MGVQDELQVRGLHEDGDRSTGGVEARRCAGGPGEQEVRWLE